MLDLPNKSPNLGASKKAVNPIYSGENLEPGFYLLNALELERLRLTHRYHPVELKINLLLQDVPYARVLEFLSLAMLQPDAEDLKYFLEQERNRNALVDFTTFSSKVIHLKQMLSSCAGSNSIATIEDHRSIFEGIV
jgi:hypothetical protein